MESNIHTMSNLFAQLGLPNTEAEIQIFISAHRSLDIHLVLCEASFWTASQAKFLREQISNDADWAGVVDELDVRLRQ